MRKIKRSVSHLKVSIFAVVFLVLIVLGVVSLLIYQQIRPKNDSNNSLSHRLPNTVRPVHYRLFIDASQLEVFRYQGTVDIELQILETVNNIRLNVVDLNVTEVRFFYETIGFIEHRSVRFNKKQEQMSIGFAQSIQAGKGRLHIAFNSQINDQLTAFYRTRDGNRTGACTQFEAAYARRAFPCFDEPSFKANFTILIRSPKHLTTLSNMPVRTQQPHDDGTCTYEFETTPVMSTYLVAFVIGAYDYVETHDANGVLIRVYTPVGKKEQGLFALKTAADILPFFAEYFGIKYPLKKLDMIAVADFGSGAMENWGLITYREIYLLVNDRTSTQKTKQEVALVVAHELAHQWFGNLVTMSWWNDLWLNEDIFATWIEFLAVDHVYPEYNIWTQFVSDILATCMIPDALQNSHPIEVPIEKPSDIDEIFDDITYEKGSSVIRLLHAFIGDEPFRQGLTNYLANYAYQNTITENLWFYLSKASNRSDLIDILSTWTKQMGYPLLRVQQKQQGADRLIKIVQTRFLADGTEDESQRWKIPINICTKSSPNQSVYQIFMNGAEKQEFLLENISSSDWIKLNLFSVGIYRVQYSPSMLSALIPAILDRSLSPQDRFNIQTDVYALARAGHVDYVEYLKLLRYAFKQENDLTVWKSILRHLTELGSIFEYAFNPSTKHLYQIYVCDLLSVISHQLRWESSSKETSQVAMLRSLILTHMGINGDSNTHQEARRRFDQLLKNQADPMIINPNLRAAIYLTVAKYGDQETFEALKMLYLKAESQEERVRLLTALCRFDNPAIQDQALEFIWDKNFVRKQDHLTGFAALAGHNRYGSEITWNYIQKHWRHIEQLYGRHDSHLIHFVESVPSLFVSEQRAEEVRTFHRLNPNPFLDRSIKKVLEQIHIRRLVLERHEDSINAFLRHF